MKYFADLFLNVLRQDEPKKLKIANLVSELGFKLVGLIVPPRMSEEELVFNKKFFLDAGIDVALRINLLPRSKSELLSYLRKFRDKAEIISVMCIDRKIVSTAVRDRRIDLVLFDPSNSNTKFKKSTANVCNAAYEINLSWILKLPQPSRINAIKKLAKEVLIARENDVKIVVSSGANDIFFLRAPREMAAFLETLGLKQEEALNAVSKIPFSIVKNNRFKLSSSFIAEGIKLIKRG
ncbi:MAG: RNase P subunit p30 family protein [Candidatus Bathyarchaeia archaeon]